MPVPQVSRENCCRNDLPSLGLDYNNEHLDFDSYRYSCFFGAAHFSLSRSCGATMRLLLLPLLALIHDIEKLGNTLGGFFFKDPDPAQQPTNPTVVDEAQDDAASSSHPSADIELFVVAIATKGVNQKECTATPAPGSSSGSSSDSDTDTDPVSFSALSILTKRNDCAYD